MYNQIIDKYYKDTPDLRNILVTHSRAVADYALLCADSRPELSIDREFLYRAAMLHDIGIFMTHAPGIHCFGPLPYICHGLAGEMLLRAEGLPELARVAGRHTGSGLSADEIATAGLPLPSFDMLPESLEEKLVCYADKFFSKTPVGKDLSPLTIPKSLAKVRAQMASFGPASAARFESLHSIFALKSEE